MTSHCLLLEKYDVCLVFKQKCDKPPVQSQSLVKFKQNVFCMNTLSHLVSLKKESPGSKSSSFLMVHSHRRSPRWQQSSHTVNFHWSCDRNRSQQHRMCTFHTSPLFCLIAWVKTPTESLEHGECEKWERRRKSDLIYPWREQDALWQFDRSLRVCVYACVSVLYARVCCHVHQNLWLLHDCVCVR